MIDNVKGNWIEKIEPTFSVESIEILPPSDSMVVFTTSRPTPRPEISEIVSAVEKVSGWVTDLNQASACVLSVSSKS